MIVPNTPEFILLGENQMSPRKVERFVVLFNTPDKGKVTAWVRGQENVGTEENPYYNEVCNGLNTEYPQSYFDGKDMLSVLSSEFQTKLAELNPKITFTITQ